MKEKLRIFDRCGERLTWSGEELGKVTVCLLSPFFSGGGGGRWREGGVQGTGYFSKQMRISMHTPLIGPLWRVWGERRLLPYSRKVLRAPH